MGCITPLSRQIIQVDTSQGFSVIETPFADPTPSDTSGPPEVKSGISEVQSLLLGIFGTPIFLAVISILTQTLCIWWIILGVTISLISLIATAIDRRFLFFALGSILGVTIFLIPWIEFVDATKVVCYDYSWVWSSNTNC